MLSWAIPEPVDQVARPHSNFFRGTHHAQRQKKRISKTIQDERRREMEATYATASSATNTSRYLQPDAACSTSEHISELMGDYTERLIFGFDGSKNKNGCIYRFSERGKAEIRECIDNLRRAIEKSPIGTTRFDARSSDEKDRARALASAAETDRQFQVFMTHLAV